MKKFVYSVAYALGTIGGIGVCLAEHYWVIAAGVLALAVIALPELIKVFKDEA